MIPQRKSLTLLVVLLGGSGLDAYGQSAERNGLRLDVAFAPGDYLLAEPLLVRCSLVNVSSDIIVVPFHRYGDSDTLLFDIIEPAGNQVRRLRFLRESVPHGVRIAPGARHVVSLNLYDEYGISEAGTYRIGVTFESQGTYHETDGVRKTGWEGSLSTAVGTADIGSPKRPTDVAALRLLAEGNARPTAPYRYALDAAALRSKILEREPDSLYAIYARYNHATAALQRFKDTTSPVFIGTAQDHLAAIDASARSPLFREDVAFARLIVRVASGDRLAARRDFETFRRRHPDSVRTLPELESWIHVVPP